MASSLSAVDGAFRYWWIRQLADLSSGTPRQLLLLDLSATPPDQPYRPTRSDRLLLSFAQWLGPGALLPWLRRRLPTLASLWTPEPLDRDGLTLAWRRAMWCVLPTIALLLAGGAPAVARGVVAAMLTVGGATGFAVWRARRAWHASLLRRERQLEQLAELPVAWEEATGGSLLTWLEGHGVSPEAAERLRAEWRDSPGAWREFESFERYRVWAPLPGFPWRQWMAESALFLGALLLGVAISVMPWWLAIPALLVLTVLPWPPLAARTLGLIAAALAAALLGWGLA